VALGDAHRNEFTMWPTNYLQRENTQEDVALEDNELDQMSTTKNLFRGIIKYYA